MSTNYYFVHRPPCECCGRSSERLHIGQESNVGPFILDTFPEYGVNSPADWERLLSAPGISVEDDYGVEVPLAYVRCLINGEVK